jgi:hypothetical protein
VSMPLALQQFPGETVLPPVEIAANLPPSDRLVVRRP